MLKLSNDMTTTTHYLEDERWRGSKPRQRCTDEEVRLSEQMVRIRKRFGKGAVMKVVAKVSRQ
jgi:hypothetical protein